MPVEEWATVFAPTDGEGAPIPPEELPLVVSLATKRPAHRGLTIRGLDGVQRSIEVTGIPLLGYEDRCLGAFALFWEVG